MALGAVPGGGRRGAVVVPGLVHTGPHPPTSTAGEHAVLVRRRTRSLPASAKIVGVTLIVVECGNRRARVCELGEVDVLSGVTRHQRHGAFRDAFKAFAQRTRRQVEEMVDSTAISE